MQPPPAFSELPLRSPSAKRRESPNVRLITCMADTPSRQDFAFSIRVVTEPVRSLQRNIWMPSSISNFSSTSTSTTPPKVGASFVDALIFFTDSRTQRVRCPTSSTRTGGFKRIVDSKSKIHLRELFHFTLSEISMKYFILAGL